MSFLSSLLLSIASFLVALRRQVKKGSPIDRLPLLHEILLSAKTSFENPERASSAGELLERFEWAPQNFR